MGERAEEVAATVWHNSRFRILHRSAASPCGARAVVIVVHHGGGTRRERERDASGTRTAGVFVWGYNAHVTYATLSPSLSVGGSSTTRTQRSLSVAREPRPEQHNALVVVRSIIAPTDTRRPSPPLCFPRNRFLSNTNPPPSPPSSPASDTLSTTLPRLGMEVSARPCHHASRSFSFHATQ